MAGIFGGSGSSGSAPAINARIQSSVQGRPRNIGAGLNRVAGNLIWYADFKSTPASSGGKGAGGSGKGTSGSYNYSASFIVSFGETVAQFNTIFNGNQIDFLVAPSAQVLSDLAALGITPTYGNSYGATFFLGDYAQNPWSYLVSAHPTQALAYRGEALMALANLGLSSSPSLPNFTAELLWPINSDIPALGPDANPADWVTAFLTNGDWGAGFPAALLGDLTAYKTWCRATGMLISPVLTNQQAANSHLGEIMKGTIADFRWSSGLLTIVPYGDSAVTGNGYTFTPSVTPIYAIGVNDYLENQGSLGSSSGKSPVAVSRKDPAQVLNRVQIEYLDRSNLYNPVTIYDSDDASIIANKRLRLSDLRAHHFFCLGSAASMSATLQMHREKVVTQYQFTLPATFILVDVLDILTITEPNLGLSAQPVRVIEIVENSDHTLTFTAEEFLGVVAAPLYSRQTSLGTARNNNVDPGAINTPIIFEPAYALGQGLEIWAAVSGANPALWGGCNVWVSYSSTGTYTQIGQIAGPARMGVLTSLLPVVVTNSNGQTIDNTNTLAVDLTQSNGTLLSGTAGDMTSLNTLCIVGGEIVSYQTATLTSANHYNLSPLVRGAYGMPAADHAIGTPFARLDDLIFKFPYTYDRNGSTLYLKFQSFNIYGGGLQSLGSLTAVPYTITGRGADLQNVMNAVTGLGPESVTAQINQVKSDLAASAAANLTDQTTTNKKTTTLSQQTSNALAAVVQETSARVAGDTANAALITQLIAEMGTAFSQGLFKIDATADPSGASASILMKVAASFGLAFSTAAIQLLATADGLGGTTSQVAIIANKFVFLDPNGNIIAAAPFTIEGSTVKLGLTRAGTITSADGTSMIINFDSPRIYMQA